MSIQDILVLLLIVVGAAIGVTQSSIKKVFRLIVVIAVILIICLALDPLAEWLCYDLQISVEVNLGDSVGTITTTNTIEEMFLVFEEIGLNPTVLSANALGLCKIVAFILLLIICLPVSLLISGLLWHLLLKRIIPEDFRKGGIISHLISGVLGGLEWLVVIVLIAIAVGQVSTALEESIMQAFNNIDSIFYGSLSGTSLEDLAELVQSYSNIFSPTAEDSHILPGILNALSSMNIDYLGMFKGLIYENGEYVEVNYADSLIDLANDIMDYFMSELASS